VKYDNCITCALCVAVHSKVIQSCQDVGVCVCNRTVIRLKSIVLIPKYDG
jgi:hypothetical protein